MSWLDLNSQVEFQVQDIVMDPRTISLNDNLIAIYPARKVDLTGNIALHTGKGNVTAGPGNVIELFVSATLSNLNRGVYKITIPFNTP